MYKKPGRQNGNIRSLLQIRIRVKSPVQTVTHYPSTLLPVLAIGIAPIYNLSHLSLALIHVNFPLAPFFRLDIRNDLDSSDLVRVATERTLELARVPLFPQGGTFETALAICVCGINHARACRPLPAIIALYFVLAEVGCFLGRRRGWFRCCGRCDDSCAGAGGSDGNADGLGCFGL